MPPRSKKTKKSTPKSKKQLDVESTSLADVDDSGVSELEAKEELESQEDVSVQQEDAAESPKEEESRETENLVIKADESNDADSEGNEDMAVGGAAVELKVKEEQVELVDVAIQETRRVENGDDTAGASVAVEENATGKLLNENVVDDKVDANVEAAVEGGDAGSNGCLAVTEQKSAEEKRTTAEIVNCNNAVADHVNGGHNDDREDIEDDGDDAGEGEDEEEEEEDPTSHLVDPFTDGRKRKAFEIFIGRLDKGAAEDDLISVFGKFGEIKTARIVRTRNTNKSKGFAFIRYATAEQAENALAELKDGVEVKGKSVKVSASQDNDTLFMGNICKTWTKEQVLATLNSYGIEHIEDIHLPVDPTVEGKIKGYALLEFNTHTDAVEAFHRLRKPDAIFGRDKSAKVAFTQSALHPNEEVLSQVKTVYVEGITDAWNEGKVKEICSKYGEITEVKLPQDLGSKRKDFGFITFGSRESAIACVEGINQAQISEEEVKIKASMAKPFHKGVLQKQGFRGGFKVKNENSVTVLPSGTESGKTPQAKNQSKGKSKQAKRNERKKKKKNLETVTEEKGKSKIVERHEPNKPQGVGGDQRKGKPNKPQGVGGDQRKGKPNKPQGVGGDQRKGKPNNPQGVGGDQSAEAKPKSEKTNHKRKNLPPKDKSRRDGSGPSHSKRPSKKPRGDSRGRQNNDFNSPKRKRHLERRPDFGAASGYAKKHRTDMAPHAGYIEPVATHHKPRGRHQKHAAGTQGLPHGGYVKPVVRTQPQYYGGYVAVQSQPHVTYIQPAVGIQGYDPYRPALTRAGGADGLESSSSYLRAVVAAPTSYVPAYSSFAGYEQRSNVGSYYQSSGGRSSYY